MKKVLYYLIIMLAFTLNACDNEMDNMQGGDKEILTSSSEIVIKDGKITYPKWLVNVVDSVAHFPCQGNRLSIPLGLYYSRRWKRTHSRFGWGEFLCFLRAITILAFRRTNRKIPQ